MSKSAAATPLAELRRNGVAADQVRAALGFGLAPAHGLSVTIS
jgi:hypothetical protein